MTGTTPLFVGLDVHTDSIAVAQAQGQCANPPVFVGAIGTRQADLDELLRRLQAKTPALVFACQAGPCGYRLYRDLTDKGFACHVRGVDYDFRRPWTCCRQTSMLQAPPPASEKYRNRNA